MQERFVHLLYLFLCRRIKIVMTLLRQTILLYFATSVLSQNKDNILFDHDFKSVQTILDTV